jgi:hypothetical protein
VSEARDIAPLHRDRVDRRRDADAPLTDAEKRWLDFLLDEALKEWRDK